MKSRHFSMIRYIFNKSSQWSIEIPMFPVISKSFSDNEVELQKLYMTNKLKKNWRNDEVRD